MLGGCTEAGTNHRADDDRRFGLAAEHVSKLRGLVQNLIEANAHEIQKHQFRDGAHAAGGGADRRADIRAFESGVSMRRLPYLA